MKDLSDMTAAELSGYLSKLRTELEDIEDERMFSLSQTGLHVSAKAVDKYESEIGHLKSQIEQVERLLQVKSPE
jgi:hypothetical protein